MLEITFLLEFSITIQQKDCSDELVLGIWSSRNISIQHFYHRTISKAEKLKGASAHFTNLAPVASCSFSKSYIYCGREN